MSQEEIMRLASEISKGNATTEEKTAFLKALNTLLEEMKAELQGGNTN